MGLASESATSSLSDMATRITKFNAGREVERPLVATKADTISMEAKLIRSIVGTGTVQFAVPIAIATPIVLYFISRLP